jgi:hypothetical protein
MYNNSVKVPKKTLYVTISKINLLLLFMEIIHVYSENNTRHINTKCTVILIVRAVPWLRRLVTDLSLLSLWSRFGQSMWDLWWKKWQWDRFFCEFLRFPFNIIPLWLSILMCHLGDEQYDRWWSQFRDSLTPQTRHNVLIVKTGGTYRSHWALGC